jgi:hypothetical protein
VEAAKMGAIKVQKPEIAMCRFWIIGCFVWFGTRTIIGYQSIREDNAITDGIK